MIEYFVVVQWIQMVGSNGMKAGATPKGGVRFSEFPSEDALYSLAQDCAYVTVEKRYEALPFA